MKNSLHIFTFFSVLNVNSQTSLIAFKSHSGNETNYFLDPNSNFGVIQERYTKIRPINDTMKVVEELNLIADTMVVDTVKMSKYEIEYHREIKLQQFRDSISKAQNDSVPYQENVNSPSQIKTKKQQHQKGNIGWWLIIGVLFSFLFVKKVSKENA